MRRFALPLAWCALSTATLFCTAFATAARAQDAASAQASIETGSSASQPAANALPATPVAAATPATSGDREARDRAWELRSGSTALGPAGGIYVVDAASGAPQSFRLQAMSEFFVLKDYLYDNDKNRFANSSFALSVTPIKYLELSAALTARSNKNSRGEPRVLHAMGDLYFDIKSWGEPTRGLSLGGDVSVNFRTGPNDAGIDASGTSIGLRANLALDLRKMTSREVPLILRGNFGYLFDNSAKMLESIEQRRFDNLAPAAGADMSDEYRHLARRDERLAFGISRVDVFRLALGLEVPIEAHERFSIHPIAEWQLDIPVNRQGFDCPYVTGPGGGKLGGTDSCLADEGVDTWNQRLSAGVRMYPGLPGLSVLLGADLGVSGTTNFVQELAPTTPYRVILAAGYTTDLQPKPPQVVVKEVQVPIPAGVPLGRIRGTVVEQGDLGVVVANAKVSFPGRDFSTLLTAADGTFVTYAFPPGEVQLEVAAEGYETGNCAATIQAEGGDVSLACALVALPRVGSANLQVLDEKGAPVVGVNVVVTGAAGGVTDVEGRLKLNDLNAGEYSARVEQAGYLVSVTPFTVKVREETQATIQLVATPKTSSVKVQGNKIQVRGTIFFAPNTATLEARSTPLLTEIANVLIQHPEILQVEVQGHTDDTGSETRNATLSEERAGAVKDWLSKAGVERDRLVAKGYGATKPLAPNLTEQNRAKNRRVEFVIVQRAGD
jgi:outer membrane protein OmpA-like peptidoglycan-associated protein